MALTRKHPGSGSGAPLLFLVILLAIAAAAVLRAGQIYGSIVTRQGPVANEAIEVDCGGAVTHGATATDGSYRVNVQQQGQCWLSLPRFRARAVVYSVQSPSAYNFELVSGQNGFELRRR